MNVRIYIKACESKCIKGMHIKIYVTVERDVFRNSIPVFSKKISEPISVAVVVAFLSAYVDVSVP